MILGSPVWEIWGQVREYVSSELVRLGRPTSSVVKASAASNRRRSSVLEGLAALTFSAFTRQLSDASWAGVCRLRRISEFGTPNSRNEATTNSRAEVGAPARRSLCYIILQP